MELGERQLHFGAKNFLDVQLKIKSLLSELSWLNGPGHWHDEVLRAIARVSAVGIWAGWHGQGFLELGVMLLSNLWGLNPRGSRVATRSLLAY
jgi:hypothetical protein